MQNQTQMQLGQSLFPRSQAVCQFFNYELSLVHCDICLHSDWQLRFHWFWFYSTESNSLYHSFILFSGSLQSLFLGNKFTKGKPDKVRCSSNSNIVTHDYKRLDSCTVGLLLYTTTCCPNSSGYSKIYATQDHF